MLRKALQAQKNAPPPAVLNRRGRAANPVILLDELGKAGDGGTSRTLDPLAQLIEWVLGRLQLQERLGFERTCAYVLAHLSPRLMQRRVKLLVAVALKEGRSRVREADCWDVMGGSGGPRPH